MKDNHQGFLSEPTLTMASINIEGITTDKQEILSEFCKINKCDILCIQETHRDHTQKQPNIPGMRLVIELPHNKYGSAIFIKPDIEITSVGSSNINNIEILTVEIGNYTVTSVYKPPAETFIFTPPSNFDSQKIKFVVGDFNSHSPAWGYREYNTNGNLVEEWAETYDLTLIHDTKLPHSFHSNIWKRGYNPDICFTSHTLEGQCIKRVYDPVPKSQHRPIGMDVYAAVKSPIIPFRRRFNFKKANWQDFSNRLDSAISDLEPIPENYERFIEQVRSVSRNTIPRGCRQQYIPGLSNESRELLARYQQLFERDPFSEDTLECGSMLLQELSHTRQHDALASEAPELSSNMQVGHKDHANRFREGTHLSSRSHSRGNPIPPPPHQPDRHLHETRKPR